MKKKLTALAAAALAAVLCFSFGGCGRGGTDSAKLVINLSIGLDYTEGTFDAEVEKAIEEKFEQDTGQKLDLQFNLYSEGEINNNIDAMFSSSREQIDGIKYFVVDSGSVIVKYAGTKDNTVELSPYIEGSTYLEKIRENDPRHIVERSGYVNIDGKLYCNMLNDSLEEKGWGWIVNKNFWQEAYDQGKTALNPADYDAEQPDYKNLKLSEYKQLMLAIKEVRNIKTPVWAYGWDLVRLFGSLYGVSSASCLQTTVDGKEFFVPPQLADGYGAFLGEIASWINDGIWEDANTATTDQDRLTYFIQGNSAVYMAYPDIKQLITAGRQFENLTDWEYMLCGPLAKEDGTVTGFSKREKTFSGIVVPYYSENTQLLMDFIDWSYSDVENYELCAYGRKGIDWEPTTVTVDGREFDAWKYPAGKEQEYLAEKPYSGVFKLLENVNVANRIDASYSQRELSYYVRATKDFEAYEEGFPYEGMFVGEVDSQYYGGYTTVVSGWINTVRSNAWAGIWPEKYASYEEYYETWRGNLFENQKSRGYIDWFDGRVRQNLAFFEEKWGVI